VGQGTEGTAGVKEMLEPWAEHAPPRRLNETAYN
jgi:hypothetical protein